MKNFKKVLVLLLAVVILISSVGCDKEQEKTETPRNANEPVATIQVDNSMNHINNTTDADGYIIENNATEYKVVISADSDDVIKEASNELALFTLKASKTAFTTITDDEATWSTDAKYISIGENKLSKSAGLEVDYGKIKTSGYQIKTVGKSIFILGTSDGSLYGVYELLKDMFNYEFFYIDTYRLESKNSVKFKNYDITEVPDIEYRGAGNQTMWQDTQTENRYRMKRYDKAWARVKGTLFHTVFDILPPTKYLEEEGHTAWYDSGVTQLCYTAHGDKDEYDLMVKEVAKVLEEQLIEQPDLNLINVSLTDKSTSCNCDKCKELTQYYGAESGAIVLFLNDVNKLVRAWFETEEGAPYKRDLEIYFFAYFKYVDAPATYDEATDTYIANHGIHCDDGVGVLVAPIGADYTLPFNDPKNKSTKDSLLGWSVVSDSITTWFYDTLFSSSGDAFVLYNTFNGYQERYQYAYKIGSRWMFNQGQFMATGGQTGFTNLKMYLSSKLAWNVNEDYNQLIEDYFETCYGDASEEMMTLFNVMKNHATAYVRGVNGRGGDCYAGWIDAKCYPKNTVMGWHNILDKALEKIEPLKESNPSEYEILYKNIACERLGVDYILIFMHEGTFSNTDFANLRKEFKEDGDLVNSSRAKTLTKGWDI